MAKKMVFGCLMAFFVSLMAFGQDSNDVLSKKGLEKELDYFFSGSFEKLQKKAAKKEKLVLVDFYTNWCKVCFQMKHVVFSSIEAKTYFPDNYLVYSLNAEERPDIAKKFKVTQYPTYIFLNEKGKEIHRITGMMTKTSFLQESQEVAKPKVPYTEFSFFR